MTENTNPTARLQKKKKKKPTLHLVRNKDMQSFDFGSGHRAKQSLYHA